MISICFASIWEFIPGLLVELVVLNLKVCLCCPIMCLYVLSSVLWCPLRFWHKKTMFGSSLPLVVCRDGGSCLSRYLFLFAYSNVQHILCCVFVLIFSVLSTLCCQFLWIDHFWLPFWCSLMFIYYAYVCRNTRYKYNTNDSYRQPITDGYTALFDYRRPSCKYCLLEKVC